MEHGGTANLRHHDVAELDSLGVDRLDSHQRAALNHRLHGCPECAEAPNHAKPHLPDRNWEHDRTLGCCHRPVAGPGLVVGAVPLDRALDHRTPAHTENGLARFPLERRPAARTDLLGKLGVVA